MWRRGRFLTLAAAAVALAALAPAPAVAGETAEFGVQPSPLAVGGQTRRTFAFSIDAGRTLRDAVRITNRTSRRLTLLVYPADAPVDAQGRVAVAERAAPRLGVARWISVDRPRVSLAPRSSTVVRFSLTPPSVIADPATAAVVVEPASAIAAGQVDVVQRVAILVRTNAVPAAGIAQPGLDGPLTPSGGGARGSSSTFPWIALLVLPVQGFFWFLLWKRRRRKDDDEDEQQQGAPGDEPAREPVGAAAG